MAFLRGGREKIKRGKKTEPRGIPERRQGWCMERENRKSNVYIKILKVVAIQFIEN